MHKYLLAAVAAAAIASPAAARDGQAYVGVEGGIVLAHHDEFDFRVDGDFGTVDYNNGAKARFRPGVDMDVIAGYDFGMFRLEGELAWKSMHTSEIEFDNDALLDIEDYFQAELDPAGTITEPFFTGDDPDDLLHIEDHATVLSLMANALVDFEAGGIGFYAGVGAGRARVKMFGDRDTAWAYQGILGMRAPISDRVDVGLKYRYFRTGRLNFNGAFYTDEFTNPRGPGAADDLFASLAGDFDARGRLASHSLLASIVFNLGSVAEPVEAAPIVEAPVAEPAPATQTCPDGTVILATDQCPAPPPPPAQPSGERG